MSASGLASRALLACGVVAVIAAGAVVAVRAAQNETPFQPKVGQPGKDVVWVPSPQVLVDKMLDMAKVTPKDLVMDLGSGDGRTVITAAKRGARAVGVEYNPELVALSRSAAAKEGVSDKATFVEADLFQTDLSQPTVITMFLHQSINMKLRPTLLNLKPGTRIVSNTFDMEAWRPDEVANVGPNGCNSWCEAFLWIVPARVEGRWKTPQGDLNIKQTFQMISGTLGSIPIRGKMTGDQITISTGTMQYRGRVTGDTIQGGNLAASRIS